MEFHEDGRDYKEKIIFDDISNTTLIHVPKHGKVLQHVDYLIDHNLVRTVIDQYPTVDVQITRVHFDQMHSIFPILFAENDSLSNEIQTMELGNIHFFFFAKSKLQLRVIPQLGSSL